MQQLQLTQEQRLLQLKHVLKFINLVQEEDPIIPAKLGFNIVQNHKKFYKRDKIRVKLMTIIVPLLTTIILGVVICILLGLKFEYAGGVIGLTIMLLMNLGSVFIGGLIGKLIVKRHLKSGKIDILISDFYNLSYLGNIIKKKHYPKFFFDELYEDQLEMGLNIKRTKKLFNATDNSKLFVQGHFLKYILFDEKKFHIIAKDSSGKVIFDSQYS
jgi:uncharacterized membrane protein